MVKHHLAGHAHELGETMLGWLRDIQKESRILGDVRGKGLMLGAELVKDRATKEPAPELAGRGGGECHRHGLLVEIGGHYDNVVRFLPPRQFGKSAHRGNQLPLVGLEVRHVTA